MPVYEPFSDYLEMIIQFGYITLFAAAMPIGALFSFFCNILEIWSDKYKLRTLLQRPLPTYGFTIGSWADVINTMCIVFVYTNLCLFGTSESIKQGPILQWLLGEELQKQYIVIFFVLEHMIFLFVIKQ